MTKRSGGRGVITQRRAPHGVESVTVDMQTECSWECRRPGWVGPGLQGRPHLRQPRPHSRRISAGPILTLGLERQECPSLPSAAWQTTWDDSPEQSHTHTHTQPLPNSPEPGQSPQPGSTAVEGCFNEEGLAACVGPSRRLLDSMGFSHGFHPVRLSGRRSIPPPSRLSPHSLPGEDQLLPWR